jgi:hypothetical protein
VEDLKRNPGGGPEMIHPDTPTLEISGPPPGFRRLAPHWPTPSSQTVSHCCHGSRLGKYCGLRCQTLSPKKKYPPGVTLVQVHGVTWCDPGFTQGWSLFRLVRGVSHFFLPHFSFFFLPRSFPLFSSPLQFFLPFFNLIPSSVNRKVPSSLVLSLFLEMWYTRWMVRLSFHPLSICPVGQSMFDLLPKSGRHRSEVCVLYTISRSLFPVWGRWATSSGHRVGSMFEVVG